MKRIATVASESSIRVTCCALHVNGFYASVEHAVAVSGVPKKTPELLAAYRDMVEDVAAFYGQEPCVGAHFGRYCRCPSGEYECQWSLNSGAKECDKSKHAATLDLEDFEDSELQRCGGPAARRQVLRFLCMNTRFRSA